MRREREPSCAPLSSAGGGCVRGRLADRAGRGLAERVVMHVRDGDRTLCGSVDGGGGGGWRVVRAGEGRRG